MTTRSLIAALGALAVLAISGCGYPKPDYSTPEKAMESIENAYRQKDIKKILWCKGFQLEAKFIVPDDPSKLGSGKKVTKEQLAMMKDSTIELCKTKFMSDLESGIPEWNGVKSKITNVRELTDDMVVVSEDIMPPDHNTIKSELFVGKDIFGHWKVLMPYSKKMEDNWMKYYGNE
ncbi:hypothetical protein BVY04_05320 [bacterium M21]|nr:hypothetical protein BVY04_05320 [bacterium M21]